MDQSHVREIVDDSIRPLRAALGLNRWRVKVEYDAIEERTSAQCRPDPRYEEARVTIDPAKMETVEHVLDGLLHELLHVFHAEFETYRQQVGQLVGEKKFNDLDQVFQRASESVVKHLEYMLDMGLGLTTKKLIRKGKRILDEM